MLGQSIMRRVRPLSVRARVSLAEWCFLPSQRSRVQARNSRQGHRNNRSNKLLPRRRRRKNPPQISCQLTRGPDATSRNCCIGKPAETQTQTKAQCAGVASLCADAYASGRCAGAPTPTQTSVARDAPTPAQAALDWSRR